MMMFSAHHQTLVLLMLLSSPSITEDWMGAVGWPFYIERVQSFEHYYLWTCQCAAGPALAIIPIRIFDVTEREKNEMKECFRNRICFHLKYCRCEILPEAPDTQPIAQVPNKTSPPFSTRH